MRHNPRLQCCHLEVGQNTNQPRIVLPDGNLCDSNTNTGAGQCQLRRVAVGAHRKPIPQIVWPQRFRQFQITAVAIRSDRKSVV